jgi:uncharacterized protein (TIGR01777 family)
MVTMSILMAGSSGFLGKHLREELERRGHRVTALVRRPTKLPGESTWDPAAHQVDQEVVAAADVVINLAGSPTLGNPHSKKWSQALHDSRVQTTETLARAIAKAATRPLFVAGNAVAWYGDHGPAELAEVADSRGHTLMTGVCRDWQAATRPAVDAGGRVIVLRTSPVMDRSSAPLRQQSLLFKAGLGGRIGSGRQYMPMISLRDWVGAAAYLTEHPTADGPANLCCVETPTNAEFTRVLADALHRPAFAAVPAPIIKIAAGRVSPELLGSMNTRPQALLDLGYEFADPDVSAVLASGLAETAASTHPVFVERNASRRVVSPSRGSGCCSPPPTGTATASASRSVTSSTIRRSVRTRSSTESTCIAIPRTRRPRAAQRRSMAASRAPAFEPGR